MKLSTQPYKGSRDFYPADKRFQKYMFNIWRKIAERYGYEEYDAPILEPTDIYLAKGNREIIAEQTYTFQDRGGRSVTIRTEMTPTVSRLVANQRQSLPYPLRWYSIPNLWRYERPQKGRLREFWQLNVDIFGIENQSAELEMLFIVNDIFKEFGATSEMFDMRINHRGLINYLLADYLQLNDTAQMKMATLIDRMHKIERTDLIEKIDEILSDEQKSSGATEKLLAVLDAKTVSDLPEKVRNHPSVLDLQNIISALNSAGIYNIRFDSTLMRGFDYYTGVVFEVFDTDPENRRSLLGGGRYDGLIGLFGVNPVPSVGFAWGDVTLANFLELHDLMPDLPSETNVYVCLLNNSFVKVQPLLEQLRSAEINVAVDTTGKKISDQIKTAEKKHIQNVVIIGDDELKNRIYTLKNLKTTVEIKLPLPELITALKK